MSNRFARFMKRRPLTAPRCLSARTLHAVDTWKIALPERVAHRPVTLRGELRLSGPAFLQFDDGLSACVSFSSKGERGFRPFVERVPLQEEYHAGQGRLLLYIRMDWTPGRILGTMRTQTVYTGLPEEAVAFASVVFSLRDSDISYLSLQSGEKAGILPGSRIRLQGQWQGRAAR